MIRPLLTLLAALVLLGPVRGAEVQDLGEGLGYLRLTDVAGEPFSAPTGPLIIDLRQATSAGAGGLNRLRGLFQTGSLRLVLVSRATAPELLGLLSPRPPGTLVIGPRGLTEADFEVSVSPEEDLKAYQRFDNGTALAELANPPLSKPRRDEAAIVAARRNGSRESDSPPAPRPPGSAPTPAPGPPDSDADTPHSGPSSSRRDAPVAAPGDPVLQRAVQLHRGLRALGRL